MATSIGPIPLSLMALPANIDRIKLRSKARSTLNCRCFKINIFFTIKSKINYIYQNIDHRKKKSRISPTAWQAAKRCVQCVSCVRCAVFVAREGVATLACSSARRVVGNGGGGKGGSVVVGPRDRSPRRGPPTAGARSQDLSWLRRCLY